MALYLYVDGSQGLMREGHPGLQLQKDIKW